MLARAVSLGSRTARRARQLSTLVIAEHDNAALSAGTRSAVTAAAALPGDTTVLVAGHGAGLAGVASAAAAVEGVANVLVLDDAALEHGLAENLCAAVKEVAATDAYTHVVACSSNFGKNWVREEDAAYY